MAKSISYTQVRERLASVLDEVASEQEEVVITRRGHEDIALVPAAELAGLRETAHLLRSPKNALRLLIALDRSRTQQGSTVRDVAELERTLGLSPVAAKSR